MAHLSETSQIVPHLSTYLKGLDYTLSAETPKSV
jgi:hypothetical protein